MISVTKKIAAGVIGLSALLSGQHALAVAGATGTTSVNVSFPDIIVLHYPSTININFTDADGSLLTSEVETVTDPAETDLETSSTFDLAIGSPATDQTALSNLTSITLQNAWAVRGITSTGTITVDITLDTATGSNGTSDVVFSNAQITDGSSTGSSIDVAAPGMATPTVGDVSFDVDTSSVTTAAAHTGIQYTMTAVVGP